MTVPTPTELERLLEQISPLDPMGIPKNREESHTIRRIVVAVPALLARIKELEEALEPFAIIGRNMPDTGDFIRWSVSGGGYVDIQRDAFTRAALTLNRSENDAG